MLNIAYLIIYLNTTRLILTFDVEYMLVLFIFFNK